MHWGISQRLMASITASIASVNCNGAVVNVNSVENEMIKTNRKKMKIAFIIPSDVT